MSPRSVLPCTRSSPARNNSLNAFRAKELSPSPVSYGTKPRGVREDSHPLALSHGVVSRSQVRHTPRARPQKFDHPRFFPAPSGVREGPRPLALSRGVARRGQVCQTLPRTFSEFRIDSFFSRFAGGARGFTPSRALPWGRKTRPSVPNVAAHVLGISNRLVFLPLRRGCERDHVLSRSPMGSQDAAECAIRCRARPQDFDCSVSFPRCRGCERVHTLSRSPMGS